MAMTRKHFEAIAQVLLEVNATAGTQPDYTATAAVEAIANGLAFICERDNPNFDRAKFLRAVGVTDIRPW